MEKTRDQIDDKYKWDLSGLYKDEEAAQRDIEIVKKKIGDFKAYEDGFITSADKFYDTLKEYFDIYMVLEDLYVYTSHRFDEDISNNKNQALNEVVSNLYSDFSSNSSFLTPKVLKLGSEGVNKFYEAKPILKKDYDFVLECILREKDHTLSLEEERLMASLSNAYSDTSSIASMLSDSDIDFGTIKDEEGADKVLTDTNYSTFMLSTDRNVRKGAFEALYKQYKQFNNTFALSLAAKVERNKTFAKVKGFNSSLESSLFDDNVSLDVYNNLIDVVSSNLKPLYRYYDIKRKTLGLDEFHMYDVYAEVVSSATSKYSFEEGKDLVTSSLEILGENYITNLKKAFDERWIDIYPNKGKRGGAYSGGSYNSNPLVLLNFNGSYHDVSTIAHELGHSMHTFYSHKNNPYQYSSYEIFVAEVASQVNELLFSNYMFNKVNTKEEKLDILNQILELFKGSIFRQTMFAEFERDIAAKAEAGEILTATVLNDTYYELVKKYFGPNVCIDEEIKYEWERIPHFYYDFYVYKYSTGLAAACHIVKRILNHEDGALEGYLNFLKTGGSDYPLNELKIAGVDLTNPEVILSALGMFEEYLNEFEKLLD